MKNKKDISKSEKVVGIISKIIVFILVFLTLAMLATGFVKSSVIPAMKYKNAEKLLSNGQYEEAIEAFSQLNYKDSYKRIYDCKFEQAKAAIQDEDYSNAEYLFSNVANAIEYQEMNVCGFDNVEQLKNEHLYLRGVKHLELGENLAAENCFYNISEDYKDAADKLKEATYKRACELLENGKENTNFSSAASEILWNYDIRVADKNDDFAYEYSEFSELYEHCIKAQYLFESLGEYEDAAAKANEAANKKNDVLYNKAKEYLEEKDFLKAKNIWDNIKDYKDVAGLVEYYAPEISFYSLSDGDKLCFGHFEQDGLAETATESLVWTVTDISDDKILLVCDNAVKVLPYEESGDVKEWKETSLYAWLNNSFIYTAFTEPERLAICDFEVNIPSRNEVYYEMDEYLSYLTPAAIISAADLSDAVDEIITEVVMTAKWWVRPDSSSYPRYVEGTSLYTSYSPEEYLGVRPAVWVSADVMRVCSVAE